MGRDEQHGPDAERRPDDEERPEQAAGQTDTAHEDVVPFDKESRLDERDPRG